LVNILGVCDYTIEKIVIVVVPVDWNWRLSWGESWGVAKSENHAGGS
jgi:hypothetical protein